MSEQTTTRGNCVKGWGDGVFFFVFRFSYLVSRISYLVSRISYLVS